MNLQNIIYSMYNLVRHMTANTRLDCIEITWLHILYAHIIAKFICRVEAVKFGAKPCHWKVAN